MTHSHAATGQSPDDRPQPTTLKQDLFGAALAGLHPLGTGLVLIDLYLIMGFFGLVLGGFAVWAWFSWWYQENETILPRDVSGNVVGGVAAAVAALAGLLALVM